MRARIHESNRRGHGFTLLEMSISIVVIATIAITMTLTTQKSADALYETTDSAALVDLVHSTLDRVLDPLAELELAGLPNLAAGSEQITYHVAVGFAGATLWGPDVLLALERDPGELDDGIDNDGDGLIDEGQVVWTENPGLAGERRVVLCHGVSEFYGNEEANGVDDNGNGLNDERGFFIDVQGDILTLRMTLERLDQDGRLLRKSAESSVRVRN